MKYKNFEDVPVWQAGIELTTEVFRITEDKNFRFKGDLANQIQRAALSIPNNIAEGFERGTTPELIMFLYYAKGSAGEVRSICHVLERLPFLAHLKSEILNLKSLAASISRQTAGWAASLQESDIKGQRYLTDQSRTSYNQKQRAAAFLEQLKREQEKRLNDLKQNRA
ncbi:MAG: four helix bundle protein [Kiritimatiellae bacterium]|jgi:four helix bundle protein|nr:four helix bundle protein [Kiritimatiellia bacterium]